MGAAELCAIGFIGNRHARERAKTIKSGTRTGASFRGAQRVLRRQEFTHIVHAPDSYSCSSVFAGKRTPCTFRPRGTPLPVCRATVHFLGPPALLCAAHECYRVPIARTH